MAPFIDNLAVALNNKSRVDIIYFDFAKAFDTVSHDLILRKLKYLYEIDGFMLNLIKSYLKGRQQQVVCWWIEILNSACLLGCTPRINLGAIAVCAFY